MGVFLRPYLWTTTPARFVNEFISGHTVVRCHHVDNLCGFYREFF
jgi:hypothetical protein